ncbi:DNA topoisomerase IB [Agromyces aerolatus]|uniref:DNA topoisomerase IB n=1 Tax=Agromyces sp. LY-1074 TaxID=3074080 RepID=UPI00285B046F|nr:MULTISPECIES: DNA topoisomerase IB [unclassified Agromyces]MDR5701918.1 DNA topoisomerase IB [Agromyces sp. LY-1074]MDR5708158.1 DNA topoisomerase IB [Agromyces sp. LY-1358]
MPRLRRVEPYSSPGWTRVRRGTGFSYVHADGSAAGRAERARFAELAVPPAWREVWIADALNAHILAVGVDAAGRRQYLYHPAWRERQDAEKFLRMAALIRALPAARETVLEDLAGDEPLRTLVLAAAFRTLDLGALRVGSEESLSTAKTRGLTTLLVRNASAEDDRVRFRFRAKGGIAQNLTIPDATLAAFVERNAERAASARLYAWRDGRRYRALSASDVNDDIRERTAGDFTAKDFRTLRGTVVAAERLAAIGPETTRKARTAAMRDAVVAASEALGNTPTIAKASYIDPRVFTAYAEGVVLPAGDMERALLELIEPDAS